jgi:hypothetical protein
LPPSGISSIYNRSILPENQPVLQSAEKITKMVKETFFANMLFRDAATRRDAAIVKDRIE